MTISPDQLDSICRIPVELGRRSLTELVAAVGYRALRPALTRQELTEHLARHPAVVFAWLRYSENKRTSGGWYLLHPSAEWIVGRLQGPERERDMRFRSGPEACAEFILRELDSVAGDPVGTPQTG